MHFITLVTSEREKGKSKLLKVDTEKMSDNSKLVNISSPSQLCYSLFDGSPILKILLIALVFCNPLFADDALLFESAHNVYPINSKNIVMQAETVNIKVAPPSDSTKIYGWAKKKILVDCIFKFVNTGEAVKDALLGFPGVDETQHSFYDSNLNDFNVWIDNKPVPVNIKEETKRGENEMTGEKDVEFPVRKWYTWKVDFAKGETKTIRNTYWGYPSMWSAGTHHVISYILETGAGWKGPIGKANITIDLNKCYKKGDIFSIVPEDYILTKDGKIKWELKNFEPDEDIQVIIQPGVQLTGYTVPSFQNEHAEKYLSADLVTIGTALSCTTKVIQDESLSIPGSDTADISHYTTVTDIYNIKVDSVIKGVFADSIIIVRSPSYRNILKSKFTGRDARGKPVFVTKTVKDFFNTPDRINGSWYVTSKTKCIALLQKKDTTYTSTLFRRYDKDIIDFYKGLDKRK